MPNFVNYLNVSLDFEVINSNQADELGAKMSGKFIKLVKMSNESQAFIYQSVGRRSM